MAEIYTHDMQLKASFTLGEGRYGPSAGAPNLGMAVEGLNARASDGIDYVSASQNENRREVDGKMESLRKEGRMLDVAALLRGDKESLRQVLQMPVEERDIVLKCLESYDSTG